MIQIIPTGGLSDRLITIESFYALAQDLGGVNIKIIWLLNDELNCNYEEILEPINGLTVENRID